MKVRNISSKTLSIPEVGVVKADAVIDVPKGFNNPNFVPVRAPKTDTKPEGKGDNKNKDKTK